MYHPSIHPSTRPSVHPFIHPSKESESCYSLGSWSYFPLYNSHMIPWALTWPGGNLSLPPVLITLRLPRECFPVMVVACHLLCELQLWASPRSSPAGLAPLDSSNLPIGVCHKHGHSILPYTPSPQCHKIVMSMGCIEESLRKLWHQEGKLKIRPPV